MCLHMRRRDSICLHMRERAVQQEITREPRKPENTVFSPRKDIPFGVFFCKKPLTKSDQVCYGLMNKKPVYLGEIGGLRFLIGGIKVKLGDNLNFTEKYIDCNTCGTGLIMFDNVLPILAQM